MEAADGAQEPDLSCEARRPPGGPVLENSLSHATTEQCRDRDEGAAAVRAQPAPPKDPVKGPSADLALWCAARPPRARSPECSASLRSWFIRGKATDVPERSSAAGRSSAIRLPSTVRQPSPPTSSAAKPTGRPTRDNQERLARSSRLAEGVTPASASRLADHLAATESNRSIPSTGRASTPVPLVNMLPSSCSELVGRKTGIYL